MESQEKNLRSLFQQLGTDSSTIERPDFKLKDAVFSTIDATSVIADIVDLFTLQFVKAQAEVVDALPENDYGVNQKEKLLTGVMVYSYFVQFVVLPLYYFFCKKIWVRCLLFSLVVFQY